MSFGSGLPFGRTLVRAIAGASVGVAAWTLTEYATHRWVLHGPFGQGRLSRIPVGNIHRNHHRDPEHTVAWARAGANLAMAGVGAGAARALTAAIPALPAAAATTAGMAWSAGYTVYDIAHHRMHHRAPTTERGVRLRQRHFRHHFGAPRGNLGVTNGIWDRVLGTEVLAAPVRIPAKFAPEWLDDLGPDFTAAHG
ncbi:MAG: sterol desaturase family protein [Actinomycetota bacterium]